MFKNYLKTAWRNLKKNKFYSVINISGLTAGLAIGILILFWVQDELGFDMFHKNAKNIYRLENQVGTGNSVQIWSVTNAPIATSAKAQIPEIKDAVRISSNNFFTSYAYADKTFTESKLYFTDPSLFSIFTFPLIKGNTSNPFPNENSIVITEETAIRYFGSENPIGKIITADGKTGFAVSGVIKNFPRNSSISGDMFFPMKFLNKKMYEFSEKKGDLDNEWEQFNYRTFLLLQPGTNLAALSDKLKQIHLKHEPGDTDIVYLPFELSKMHLYKADGSSAGIETVRSFTIVALLILVIACINYVNLSTARSMLRSKEVSLRKIIGAERSQLFFQFVIETALLFVIASLLAIVVIYLLLPVFNSISGKELVLNLADKNFWSVLLVSITGTLIISSIYPAMLLSTFKPIDALKGKISKHIGDAAFRKILVVSQFTISVALITGTIIIGKQLDYIRTKELGYDKSHVFSFFLPDAGKHFDAVKDELTKSKGIQAVTRSSSNIVALGELTGNNSWDGKLPDQTFMMYPLSVDKDFIPFFKLQLVEGSNFTNAVNDSLHFILNETAVRQAGIKNPIGKMFKLHEHKGTIIGVVKDFHFASLKQKIEPSILYYDPLYCNMMQVRTTAKDAPAAIAAAKSVWNEYHAGTPFNYDFLDDTFNNLYKTEQTTGTLFNIFAGIAILISCLGLLGLAAYTAQVRTREIGVRKVLGASVGGIVQLLARDFIALVFISIVIAVPISWYAMNKWLQDFAYKANINWVVYALAGLIAIGIAVFTISFQSVKAALANPVRSLRSE